MTLDDVQCPWCREDGDLSIYSHFWHKPKGPGTFAANVKCNTCEMRGPTQCHQKKMEEAEAFAIEKFATLFTTHKETP